MAEVEHLWHALQDGIGHHGSIGYSETRMDTLHALRRNAFTYIAFKRHHHIKDLVDALSDDKGQIRNWSTFKREALKISNDYNVNWLKAEYNTTVMTAQTAAQWSDFQKNKDILPYLQYKTQSDELVRKSHRPLHDVTKHIDDPFWDEFYPPNGWQCRCYVLQVAEGDGKDPEVYPNDKEVPPVFRHNAAKDGIIFGSDHPYFAAVPDRVQRARVLDAMRNVLVNEDIYDVVDNNITAHITHDGLERAENLAFAQLLNRSVRLLPRGAEKGVTWVDMMDMELQELIEYKHVTTTSVNNIIRNSVSRAIKQYNHSLYKDYPLVIALQIDNIDQMNVPELIRRVLSRPQVSALIIQHNDVLTRYEK